MGQIHSTGHPKAGEVVALKDGREYRVEDWWDRVAGKSWMFCDGNPACLNYAMRSGAAGLPTNNEVLYGKIGAFGHLIHASELAGD